LEKSFDFFGKKKKRKKSPQRNHWNRWGGQNRSIKEIQFYARYYIAQTPVFGCCGQKAHHNCIDVLNFFSGKTSEESETYIQICKQIETLYKGNPTK